MNNPHKPPLVALISATPVAIAPAATAFREAFPEATLWNLLDDRLLEEATAHHGVTPALGERMKRLIRHAEVEGADGILLTCSMYGPVAEQIADELRIPVYGPDSAAFEEALRQRATKILLLASAPAPLQDALERFGRAAQAADRAIELSGAVATGAAEAATSGNTSGLVRSLDSACKAHGTFDAVLLAQYSLAPAATELSQALGKPVLAGPVLAAAALRAILVGTAPAGRTELRENP